MAEKVDRVRRKFLSGETVFVNYDQGDGNIRFQVQLTLVDNKLISGIVRPEGMSDEERQLYGSDTDIAVQAVQSLGLDIETKKDAAMWIGHSNRPSDFLDENFSLKEEWKKR